MLRELQWTELIHELAKAVCRLEILLATSNCLDNSKLACLVWVEDRDNHSQLITLNNSLYICDITHPPAFTYTIMLYNELYSARANKFITS